MSVAMIGLASILAFVGLFTISGLIAVARRAISRATTALAVMRDPALDDDAKEAEVQKASLALFRDFGGIVLRSALVLTGAAVPLYVSDLAGIVPVETTLNWLMRWDVIIGASALIGGAAYAMSRLKGA